LEGFGLNSGKNQISLKIVEVLGSISLTFYAQILYSGAKKFQSQTVTREKLPKILSYEKGVLKTLMKLTPYVLFLLQSVSRI